MDSSLGTKILLMNLPSLLTPLGPHSPVSRITDLKLGWHLFMFVYVLCGSSRVKLTAVRALVLRALAMKKIRFR